MLLTLAALAASATTPLTPSGKWVVDYATNMCVVSRPFGPAPDTVTLAIKPAVVMSSNAATLLIVSPKTTASGTRRGIATVTLQPSGQTVKVEAATWSSKDGTQRYYYAVVESDFGAAIDSATEIDFTMGDSAFALQPGKFQSAMAALRACKADLFKSWGIDSNTPAEPLGSPARWFLNDDYPSEARREQATGPVIVRVDAANDGKVVACTVLATSKSAILDKATCDLARRRARFQPFTGAAPRAMVLSVRWQLDG